MHSRPGANEHKAVADRAHVSTATVSRTINGSTKVAPAPPRAFAAPSRPSATTPIPTPAPLAPDAPPLRPHHLRHHQPLLPRARKVLRGHRRPQWLRSPRRQHRLRPGTHEICVSRMLERKVDGVAVMTSEMGDSLIEVDSTGATFPSSSLTPEPRQRRQQRPDRLPVRRRRCCGAPRLPRPPPHRLHRRSPGLCLRPNPPAGPARIAQAQRPSPSTRPSSK